ncbi:MAG: hypothetical protein ACI31M_03415 [Bacilli bacterium]
MNIREIFFELIKEAKNGKVLIDKDNYYVGFNTNINDEIIEYNEHNTVELFISNLELFMDKMQEYISLELELKRKSINYIKNLRDYVKFLMMYLFVNATTEDFRNPVNYIEKYINYLRDNTLESFNEGKKYDLDGLFIDNQLYIKNTQQSIMMETPFKIELSIINKDNTNLTFILPEISYGISYEKGETVCYIYSILNKENINKVLDEDILSYKKNISRKLYKMNKGISDIESEEFNNFKNGNSDYYPENITDVSVSSVLSLFVFINLIKDKVDKIKGVPYLPIRYLSREYASYLALTEERRKELQTRNNNIQTNLTEKFIRTFRRVEQYIDDVSISSYPYEVDEFITCSISNKKMSALHNEVIDSVNIKNR